MYHTRICLFFPLFRWSPRNSFFPWLQKLAVGAPIDSANAGLSAKAFADVYENKISPENNFLTSLTSLPFFLFLSSSHSVAFSNKTARLTVIKSLKKKVCSKAFARFLRNQFVIYPKLSRMTHTNR